MNCAMNLERMRGMLDECAGTTGYVKKLGPPEGRMLNERVLQHDYLWNMNQCLVSLLKLLCGWSRKLVRWKGAASSDGVDENELRFFTAPAIICCRRFSAFPSGRV